MKFMVIHPQNGELIYLNDHFTARMAALELGTHFYYPCHSTLDSDFQSVVILDNGKWVEKKISELECSCGSCSKH